MSIWTPYFTTINGLAYCNNEECKKLDIKIKRTDGNTSGLAKHMKNYHPDEHAAILKEQEAAKEEKKGKEVMGGGVVFKEKLLKFVLERNETLDLLEDEDFKNFVIAAKSFKGELPSIDSFKNDIAILRKNVEEYERQQLAIESVAIACDTWTSRQNETHVGLTAHYINSDFVLCSKSLDCAKLDGARSAENIKAKLDGMLALHGIKSPVAIVTDTAANLKELGTMVGYPWHGCLNHMLELVTNVAFDMESVEAARSIVSHFQMSPKEHQILLDLQLELNMKPPLSLTQNVDSLWCSAFCIVERFLEVWVPIKRYHCDQDKPMPVTVKQYNTLLELQNTLQKFHDAQMLLISEKCVTISQIPFVLAHLQKALKDASTESVSAEVKKVCSDMLNKFDSLFTNNGVLSLPDNVWLAYVLDPYYKGHKMVEKDSIVDKLRAMVAAVERPVTSSTASSTHIPAVTETKRHSGLFDEMFESLQKADSAVDEVADEVSHYLSIPKLAATKLDEQDPLLWWAHNTHKYPCLSMIARKVLCIPATSASSESLFSLIERTTTDERSTVDSDLARDLVYLRTNWVPTRVHYPARSRSLKRPRVEVNESTEVNAIDDEIPINI